MGRASRAKRERRLARAANGVGTVKVAKAVPKMPVVEQQETSRQLGVGWGGRRIGTGRPRLYANAAERQAAYRARRRPRGE